MTGMAIWRLTAGVFTRAVTAANDDTPIRQQIFNGYRGVTAHVNLYLNLHLYLNMNLYL